MNEHRPTKVTDYGIVPSNQKTKKHSKDTKNWEIVHTRKLEKLYLDWGNMT